MIQSFPSGSQVVCPFYIASRGLTKAELEAYEEGRGLPIGIGLTPTGTISVEYWEPEQSASKKLEGSGVEQTGAGEYEGILEGVAVGLWTWRGVIVTPESKPLAATVDQVFQIMQSRSN